MKQLKIITVRPNGTKRIQLANDIPALTDQSFKDDCDINSIMKRLRKTGHISHMRHSPGTYADLTSITDLHTSIIQVQKAQEAFDTLPAQVRKRFHNDPSQLVDFLHDSANDEEAIQLGLKYRPESTDPKQGAPLAKPAGAKPKAPKKEEVITDDEGNT